MTTLYIELIDVRLYAYHGALPQENRVGNHYRIDLSLKVDAVESTYSDQLEDTISYADVYALIAEEMKIPSQLLEHVAGRIGRRIMATYPLVLGLKLSISKLCPPIEGFEGNASVRLEMERPPSSPSTHQKAEQ